MAKLLRPGQVQMYLYVTILWLCCILGVSSYLYPSKPWWSAARNKGGLKSGRRDGLIGGGGGGNMDPPIDGSGQFPFDSEEGRNRSNSWDYFHMSSIVVLSGAVPKISSNITLIDTYHGLTNNSPTTTMERRKRGRSFLESFGQWWIKATEGHSGLLLVLAPTIAYQLRILQAALPFCIDRVMQYVQPLNFFFLSVISSQRGLEVTKTSLWIGIGIGVAQMLRDTFRTGALWMVRLSPVLKRSA